MDRSSPGFVVTVIATTPEIRIQGNTDPNALGQVLDSMTDVSERVLSFKFEDDEEKHDVLKLTVDNSDLYFLEHPAWVKGNLVRFFFGYPGAIFPGPEQGKFMVVDSVRGFETLTITCVEQAGLANEAKCAVFEDTNRADLVDTLVANGAFPGVVRAEIGGRAELVAEGLQTFNQARQSDWQFIQRLAEPVGYEVYVEGEVLYFARRQLGGRPVRSYEYFFGEGLLLDFKIGEWRVTDRPRETKVVGRDPIARKRIEATGSDANTARNTMGNQNSLAVQAGGGLSSAPSGTSISMTPRAKQATVTQEANMRFRRTEEEEIKAKATIIGDPLLAAKNVIEITGLSQQLSGKYYVKKIVHTIDRGSGYKCALILLKNAVTNTPSGSSATLNPSTASENTQELPSDPRLVLVSDGTGLKQRRQ